jgi:hypothetical protein
MTPRLFEARSNARILVRQGVVLGVVLTLALGITATLALAAVDR